MARYEKRWYDGAPAPVCVKVEEPRFREHLWEFCMDIFRCLGWLVINIFFAFLKALVEMQEEKEAARNSSSSSTAQLISTTKTGGKVLT